MYNRYVPQSDGSHSRRRIQTDQPRQPKPPTSPPEPPCEKPQTFLNCTARQETGAVGFLRNLLPKDFDTGDLLIVLLLLLMAGDSKEDQSWAWLTLALYLFL
jgi:hypothetical protein